MMYAIWIKDVLVGMYLCLALMVEYMRMGFWNRLGLTVMDWMVEYMVYDGYEK